MNKNPKTNALTNKFILLLLFAATGFFSACGGNGDEAAHDSDAVESGIQADMLPSPNDYYKQQSSAETSSQGILANIGAGGAFRDKSTNHAKTSANEKAPTVQRKLIKTGRLELEVDSVETCIAKTKEIIARYSGFIAESSVSKQEHYGYAPHTKGSLTLRIPAEHFDATIASLKALGKLKRESVSTEDVTKEYFDIETRLRVKRSTEERLRTLLKTRTGNVSQVLEVERELERLTTEIEGLLGNKRYYDQRISLSTLHCQLITPVEAQAEERPNPFSEIIDAFGDFLTILSKSLGGLIRLTAASIPWLISAFIIWKGIVFIRIRYKAKQVAKKND